MGNKISYKGLMITYFVVVVIYLTFAGVLTLYYGYVSQLWVAVSIASFITFILTNVIWLYVRREQGTDNDDKN